MASNENIIFNNIETNWNTTKDEKIDKMEPKEFFDFLKGSINETTDKDLNQILVTCLSALEKFKATGQKTSIEKMKFIIKSVRKEIGLYNLGIKTFVYRKDIEDFIERVSEDVVKIQELKHFERMVPDEIVDIIKVTEDIFDELYVVFTDYTGEAEQKVEEERREKDPILFGVFRSKDNKSMIERFYYLGDWVDEYCDLTLEKMVSEINKDDPEKKVTHEVNIPFYTEDLQKELNSLNSKMKRIKKTAKVKKGKIKTFLGNIFKKGE